MLERRRMTFMYLGSVSVGYTGAHRTKTKYWRPYFWSCSLFLFFGAVVDRTI
jgi:hypothetical protein